MRIGIDGRLWSETGVGRYIRNLVGQLGVIDKRNEYVLFLIPETVRSVPPPNRRWKIVPADVHWHTLREQLLMPPLLSSLNPDLIHVPYFNLPVFYPGRMIMTVHDLIILHFATGKATTKPPPEYFLKRTGYKFLLAAGLRKARRLIAVSETTKKEIIEHMHIGGDRIEVTYEGIDRSLFLQKPERLPPFRLPEAYILYVGNAYPHKNLEFLVRSFIRIRKSLDFPLSLLLVGKDDYFYGILRSYIRRMDDGQAVTVLNSVDDGTLSYLYRHARAFVMPSLMEGFGLPALEAAAFGVPLLLSDIPVFHETLGDLPRYFDPTDGKSFDVAIRALLTERKPPVRTDIRELLRKYSWRAMAERTLAVYKEAVR